MFNSIFFVYQSPTLWKSLQLLNQTSWPHYLVGAACVFWVVGSRESLLRWTELHWVGLHLLFWMGVRWLQLCLIISLSSLSFIQISFLLYVKGLCFFSTSLLRSFFHILVIVLIELTCALLSLPQWLQEVRLLPAVFVKSVSSSCS